jgi:hypothetical protein
MSGSTMLWSDAFPLSTCIVKLEIAHKFTRIIIVRNRRYSVIGVKLEAIPAIKVTSSTSTTVTSVTIKPERVAGICKFVQPTSSGELEVNLVGIAALENYNVDLTSLG